MPTTKTYIGDFTVKSGSLIVGDPCYKLNSWCLVDSIKALNGKWKVHLLRCGEEKQALLIHHENFPTRANAVMRDLLYGAPVDSGQLCVHDKKYWGKKSAIPKGFFPKGYEARISDDDPWYEMHCKITTDSELEAGVIPFGCVTSTAYGDGTYHVEGIKKYGRFTAIRIHLI